MSTFGEFMRSRWPGAGRTPSLSERDLWPIAPDSQFCARAEEKARDLQSGPVVNHGYRTWVFAHALSQIDGAPQDPELVYAGGLLHDAGIEHPVDGECFTKRGAQAALDAASAADLEQTRAHAVADGIGMHFTPGISTEDSPLAYYFQAGAMVDLAGLRAKELPRSLLKRASAEFPRLDVHKAISKCLRIEAKTVPGGRTHFAHRYGGLGHIVRWLPPAK